MDEKGKQNEAGGYDGPTNGRCYRIVAKAETVEGTVPERYELYKREEHDRRRQDWTEGMSDWIWSSPLYFEEFLSFAKRTAQTQGVKQRRP